MKKPNILFILADDQRFDTLGVLGNSEIKTPNLDALAARGTLFTRAHIPGGTSGAVCMPSRAMINSGRTLFHLSGEGQSIPDEHTTMGECFRAQGYDTIGIGKWHSGPQSYARSFTDGDDIFFGGMWDHWNVPVCSYHEDGVYESKHNFTPDFFHHNHPMPMISDKVEVGKHSTELFCERAIDFINDMQGDNPFFMYLSFLAPHDPRTMPERFRNMYKSEDITLPANFMSEHPFHFGIGDDGKGEMRDEDLAAYPRTPEEVRRHIAEYYAMISHIDYNLGLVFDALEAQGKLDDTIIIFTGDNGLAVGRHGLMGKQSCYDHSIRVPLIAAGPGIERGAVSDAYVYLLDIYPTLCDMSGIDIPQSVEGKSFAPVLRAEASKSRDSIYFVYTHLIRGVKDERYKLIEYSKTPEHNQLFDLQDDPDELNNRYDDPALEEEKAKLKALMLSYRDKWEDNGSKHTIRYWEAVSQG